MKEVQPENNNFRDRAKFKHVALDSFLMMVVQYAWYLKTIPSHFIDETVWSALGILLAIHAVLFILAALLALALPSHRIQRALIMLPIAIPMFWYLTIR